MTISLRFLSVAACLCLFSMTGAHAEYYLVYPATVGCCNSCTTACSPCATCQCNACMNTCHTIAVYSKRLYHDSWRDHDNRRNHYTIEAIDVACISGSCDAMQGCSRQRNHAMVRYDYAYPRHPHYVNTANDRYDPDMSTADDEVMVDSDMNNQY